jgi:hypothetical protein
MYQRIFTFIFIGLLTGGHQLDRTDSIHLRNHLTWNSFSHSVFYAVDDIHLITDIEPCPAGQVELSTHSAQSTNQTSFNLLPSDERIDLISAQPTDTNNLKGHNTQAHWPFSQTTAPLDCTDNFRFLAFSAGLPLNFLQFQNFSPGRIQPDFISFLLAFSAGSLLNRIETLTHRTANTRNIINFIFLQLAFSGGWLLLLYAILIFDHFITV